MYRQSYYARNYFIKGDDVTADLHEDPDMDMLEISAEELALEQSGVIPFPQELDPDMAAEIMNVFDAQVLFMVHPGMGQMCKAILRLGLFGVVVCRNKAHKELLMKNLKDYAKKHHLVPLTGAPVKTPALIEYENTQKTKSLSVGKPAPPALPQLAPGPPTATPVVVPKATASVDLTVPTPTSGAPKPSAPKLVAFGSSLLM